MDQFFNQQTLSTFYGSTLTLGLGFLVWLIKSAFDNHRKQRSATTKIERIYVNNLGMMADNKKLIEQWLKSFDNRARFTCNFGKLIVNEESLFDIHDLTLLNKLIKNNFYFKGLNDDVENAYTDYKKMSDALMDRKVTDEAFLEYCKYITPQLNNGIVGIQRIEKEIIDTIAHIRLFGKNRSIYSIFGILDYLNKDIWPKISEKRLLIAIDKLNKQRK